MSEPQDGPGSASSSRPTRSTSTSATTSSGGGKDLEPAGYASLLEDLKDRVRTSRVKAVRAANTELLTLYWSIGRDILQRQEDDGWGTKVVERLAADLHEAFPDQRGWSRRNLQYMRAFAAAWPEADFQRQFVHQAVLRT